MPATRPNDSCRFTLSSVACCAATSVITLCVVTLAGCGDDSGLQRIEVAGDLSWGDGIAAGQPVADGLISFLPATGLNGPAASADIQDGHYWLNDKTGPVAGPHRIVVSVESVPTGNGPSVDPANKSGGLRRWEFQFEVPQAGPVTHNLTLDDV